MVTDNLSRSPAPFSFRFRPFYSIGLVAGLMLVSGGIGWWLSQAADGEPSTEAPLVADAGEAVSVKTAIARQQSINADRVLTGTVEPVETVTLTSRVHGQIRQLPVQEGDRVITGETLVVIDAADIQAQGSQAVAGVTMAQANYQAAQAQVHQAGAQLLEAEADLANAQLEQRRMQLLQAEGAVSQQVLDQATTRVNMAQARIQQIQAGITQSQATMNQAQAQIRQAQAQVAQASANLDYGTITAPFDGVVTRRHTEVGAMAGSGQPLVTLESSDRLRFSTQVPESLMTQVRQGQTVTVRLDALNRDIAGTVSQVIPSADPSTRNFTVKVTFRNAADIIPGMFGRLQLPHSGVMGPGDRTALMIPQAALVQQFGITGIYKVVNGQASFHPVTTGKTHGTDIEVFSGVEEGDRLVLEPSPDLQDGTPLQVN